jgi:hypothetical protein
VVALLLLACAPPPSANSPTIEAETGLDAVGTLERASLDLRGVRPTETEVSAVESDPAALPELLDGFLDDARFEGRVADLWNEIYRTRSESYMILGRSYGLDDGAFQAAVGDEVPRFVARVAAADRPWSEIATASWTMADETLAAAWPIEYPQGGSGWVEASYDDGRPAAGVLATNSLWWRYPSNDSNANRKRANTASRVLLCNDYLVRPIEFDRNVNLLDDEAVAEAVKTNPGCVNCHVSLDPLASYFYGFWWYDYTSPLEARRYYPERETEWKGITGVAPGFYGSTGYTLADLGKQIVADHRFPECAVEQAWELLLRRETQLSDTDALVHHRDAFIAGELRMKALLRSIVDDAAYRSVDTKLMTPDLLADAVEDLTGFRWTYGGADLLATDAVGFRTLAGGADGYAVTAVADTPNATIALVQARLAEAAAAYAVDTEPTRLLGVDFAAAGTEDRAEMAAQVQALHLRLFGRRVAADGEEVIAALALWDEIDAIEHDPRRAWAAVLTALLRDPDFVLY